MARNDMLVAIGVDKKEEDYPEFDIPEGMDVADFEEDVPQEVVAEVKLKDGKLCLVSVNGISVGEGEEVEEEEVAEDEGDDEYIAEETTETPTLRSRAAEAGLI